MEPMLQIKLVNVELSPTTEPAVYKGRAFALITVSIQNNGNMPAEHIRVEQRDSGGSIDFVKVESDGRKWVSSFFLDRDRGWGMKEDWNYLASEEATHIQLVGDWKTGEGNWIADSQIFTEDEMRAIWKFRSISIPITIAYKDFECKHADWHKIARGQILLDDESQPDHHWRRTRIYSNDKAKDFANNYYNNYLSDSLKENS